MRGDQNNWAVSLSGSRVELLNKQAKPIRGLRHRPEILAIGQSIHPLRTAATHEYFNSITLMDMETLWDRVEQLRPRPCTSC